MKSSKVDEQLVRGYYLNLSVSSLIQWGVCTWVCVCVCFVGDSSFKQMVSRGKRRKSLIEQQLLWISVMNRQMKINRRLNLVTKGMKSSDICLEWCITLRRLTLWKPGTGTVVASSVSMPLEGLSQQTLLSFLFAWMSPLTNTVSKWLWRLWWSVSHF